MRVIWIIACLMLFSQNVSASEAVSSIWKEFSGIRYKDADVKSKSSAIRALFDRTMADVLRHPEVEDDEGIRDVFKMMNMAYFYASVEGSQDRRYYLDGMDRMFSDLVRRGIETKDDISAYHESLILSRRFHAAAELLRAHGVTDAVGFKTLQDLSVTDKHLPAAYMEGADGRVVLSNVDYSEGAYVVIVIGCHFAEDAARSLIEDERLASVIKSRRVLWLFSATDLDPGSIRDWNQAFPDLPAMVACENSTWKDVDFGATPMFHYFRNGQLMNSFSGWDQRDGRAMVQKALSEIGLIKEAGR